MMLGKKNVPRSWRIERQLISYVYEYPDITRAELAKRLGQSSAAISLVIRRLITQGWLKESGRAASLGGRRPVQLRLQSGRAFIIGLDVESGFIRSIVMDADGTLIEKTEETFKSPIAADNLIKLMHDTAQKTLSTIKIMPDQLMGIGIAILGVIHAQSGQTTKTPSLFEWERVDLVKIFEEFYPEKIVLLNSACRCRLNYEVYSSSTLRKQTTFMIDLGYVIGAALSVNNTAYEGLEGANIDFSELPVFDADHSLTTLQKAASTAIIISKVRNAMLLGAPTILDNTPDGIAKLNLRRIAKAAQSGDQLCSKALYEAADSIADAVVLIANAFRPKAILFCGELVECGGLFLDQVKRRVRIFASPDVSENLRLAETETDEFASAIGAAHTVLSRWLTGLAPEED